MKAVPDAAATPLDAWTEYLVDTAQRSVLFWDVTRQRGDQYRAHLTQTAPNVLAFTGELVADGRELERPCNYGLVRITPPQGVVVDSLKRPFVVVDPRAGHGPGIGGFKADSEIGVALRAGHPCYFIGFLPHPEPGQTVEDVMRAEIAFVERVAALHAEAEGKPVVVGNCQAGWQLMMAASVRPDVFGPIIIAGSPLSYWAGVRGRNPLRYTGGMMGGSWLTALTGDLGAGIFDGAWLVQNFESMNPANTLWSKTYNLWANVDREAQRYLGFERWWGGHVLLNAEEMQYIVDNLFVGNRLATAGLVTSDGVRIDLREIRTPIICFCSKGDDITPPQQALGWIPDLYESVDDIRAAGQTIVYAVHEHIGHLGIFVSASVAKKEHEEFASNIDLIDCLPPGLYEAVITPKLEDDPHGDLVGGDFLIRFEARTLDHLRALGGNSDGDERCFAATARASEVNLGLYRTLARPWVQALTTPAMAEWSRRLHPLRLPYELLSSTNPMMAGVQAAADAVLRARRQAAPDNPYTAAQETFSRAMVAWLDGFRDARDAWQEATFFAVYGSPLVQALLGLKGSDAEPRPRPGVDPDHLVYVQERIEELRRSMGEGGLREAAIRALLYVLIPQGAADERRFGMLKHIRARYAGEPSLAAFKELVRQQFLMLLLDEAAAVAAIPDLLAGHEEHVARVFADVRQVAEVGELGPEGRRRLSEVAAMFEAPAPERAARPPVTRRPGPARRRPAKRAAPAGRA